MSTAVVLVGAGKVGSKEASVLQHHPEYEFVAVCERDPERRRSVGDRTGVPTFESLDAALVSLDDLDLVQIATPPATHYDLANRALEAGADVYVEKIMTLSTADATSLVETARERGRTIHVRRNSLYTPSFRKLFAAMDDVGDVRHVSFVNAVTPYDAYDESKAAWLRELPGGAVSEHLPHALYVVRRLLGVEPTDVDATYDGENLSATLDARGATGTIQYVPPGPVAKTITVVGTEGAVLLNADARQIQRLERSALDSPKARIAADNARTVLSSASQAVRTGLGHVAKHAWTALGSDRGRLERNTHYRQLTDVASTSEHDLSGEEGRRNVAAFEAVWEAAGET